MAAPSADYILAMLNPYKGFSTADSARAGIAAGSAAAETRDRRKGMAQQKELAVADDARAGQYLDLQKQGQDFNQKQDLNDRRMKAYAGFQAAVDAGDTEGAALAANALRMLGVDVQEYGGGGQQGEAPKAAPAPSGAMGAMAQQSPSAAIAQAEAAPKPTMSAKDAQTSKDLGALSDENKAISAGDAVYPGSGNPMGALPPTMLPRPAPQRAGDVPAPEVPAAEPEATGPRPGPARTQFIEGQEPAEAGEAKPEQGLLRGYRLSFDGQTIDIDPESVAERQRQRVAQSLAPLLQNASTPEEQRAAATAIQAAMASVGTLKPNEAIEYGLGLYKDPLDRGAKEKRARIVSGKGAGAEGFGGVGGLDKNKNQVLGQLNDDIRTYVQGFESKFDVQNIRKALDNGSKVGGLLSGNSVGQRAALASTLKGWFSAVTTDKELKFLLESSGKLASIETGYNAWVNGGELSEDFVSKLKETIAFTNDYTRRKLHDVGEQAAQGLLNDFTFTGRMSPEQAQAAADNIRGRFTGVYKTEKKKAGAPLVRGSKAPKKEAPPAKGSAADRARKYGY